MSRNLFKDDQLRVIACKPFNKSIQLDLAESERASIYGDTATCAFVHGDCCLGQTDDRRINSVFYDFNEFIGKLIHF